MRTRIFGGHGVGMTDDGYLADAGQWSASVAEEIAREEGIEVLTPEHWAALAACRERAAEDPASCSIATAVDRSGIGRVAVTRLFNGSYSTLAKIAGFPRPAQSRSQGERKGRR